MNRPLLFRAWDEKLRKMFVPHHIDGSGTLVSEERHEIGNGMFGTHPIEYPNPYVLMQFTGLLDSKGKEIYEGDVVSKDNTPFEIRFINGCFVLSYLPEKGFWLDIRSTLESMEGTDIHYDTLSSYEIIGNIFENPDLLKDHLIK